MNGQAATLSMVEAAQTIIVPGDVLVVTPSEHGSFTAIGTNGGLLGHVLIAVGRPTVSRQTSPEALRIKSAWPAGSSQLLKVPTVESTRSRSGLHYCELILAVDVKTGCMWLVADIVDGVDSFEVGHFDLSEAIEVWQSPAGLRCDFRTKIMTEVLHRMGNGLADWSKLTAARAVFRNACLCRDESSSDADLLNEVSDCWESAPICTSVIVAFWQQYLCEYAKAIDAPEMDLIMKWMPLRADRVLPGELTATLKACGWTHVKAVRVASTTL